MNEAEAGAVLAAMAAASPESRAAGPELYIADVSPGFDSSASAIASSSSA
jgi:hypothetical protein